MTALHEEFRPRTFADVAGQDEAVRAIERVLARGWGGRAWWITGASGTGKTTLAKLIADYGASEFGTEEIEAGRLTPAALRELERGYCCRTLPQGERQLTGRAMIVNECHALRRDSVRSLLDAMERLPGHTCWIFTTTKIGQQSLFDDDPSGDCAPLISRCVEVVLEDGAAFIEALAVYIKKCAVKAGCDGLPLPVYQAALQSKRGNGRAVFQAVESGQLAKEARSEWVRYLSQPIALQNAARRAQIQEWMASTKGV